jgi:hypothetical protein
VEKRCHDAKITIKNSKIEFPADEMPGRFVAERILVASDTSERSK